MPGILGPHAGGSGQGLGFWAQQPIVLGPGPVGAQLYSLPPNGPVYAVQTWTFSSLTLLLAPPPTPPDTTHLPRPPAYSPRIVVTWDRFWSQNLLQNTLALGTPANQYDWPTLRGQLQPDRSFTASYNLNLIGQDQLAPGEQRTDLVPRPYEHHFQLRSWVWSFNLNLIPQLPAGQQRTDLWPLPAQQPTQVLVAFYNVNLIGQDKLPVRQQDWPLTPTGPAYPGSLRSWIVPLNIQSAPAPGPTPLPRAPHFSAPRDYDRLIQLRTWINSVNLALVSAVPPDRPKNQYDWPLTPAAQQAAPTWTSWYNQNLIGQDRLPARQQDWPNPVPPARQPDLNNWLDRTKLQLIKPFLQSDWPLTPAPAPIQQTIAAWYNKNLIGQDQLPPGKDTFELSPRDYERSIQLRTWIQSVNLALVTTPPLPRPPFSQYDWPLTPAVQQSALGWASWYNRNLIGKDQLPSRQQDWPNPTPFPLQPDLRTWIDRIKVLLRPAPFRQSDWPLTPAARQAALSWTASYNLNLIGKDRLPVRQQDWPLPTKLPTATELRSFIAFAQLRPVFKPFAQYHWPLPRGPLDAYWLRSITQGRALFGGGVIPPAVGVIDLVTVFLASYYGVFFAEEVIKGTPQLAAQEPGADFVSEVETGTVDLTENYAKDQKKAAD